MYKSKFPSFIVPGIDSTSRDVFTPRSFSEKTIYKWKMFLEIVFFLVNVVYANIEDMAEASGT